MLGVSLFDDIYICSDKNIHSMTRSGFLTVLFLLWLTVITACEAAINTLEITRNKIEFNNEGGSVTIRLTTDADNWSIEGNTTDWLTLSRTSGNESSSTIKFTALSNDTNIDKTAVYTLIAGNAPEIQIVVTQSGAIFPSYNASPLPPDSSGMAPDALFIADHFKMGWNIGNTLEAIGGETAWGNPKVSKELIDLVKQNGFNAIRIPCSWNQYVDDESTAHIKDSWLSRVKEVVKYCVDNDMYVLLNIHWDGGWLENNCTVDKQAENNAKQKAFWEQIATALRDFDYHLMFASANEPNVDNVGQMIVLDTYHQTFVNAVRSTGGRNSYRVLVVQGPSTDIDRTDNFMNSLPVDSLAGRMMVEVHYYTPWNFTGMSKDESWGNMFYYWGNGNHSVNDPAHNPTWGEESTADELFLKMKHKFADKGIPVILGEYGAMLRTGLTGNNLELHKKSRVYYFKYVTMQSKANGMLPFFWDTGDEGALFDRNNLTIKNPDALEGIKQGAGIK